MRSQDWVRCRILLHQAFFMWTVPGHRPSCATFKIEPVQGYAIMVRQSGMCCGALRCNGCHTAHLSTQQQHPGAGQSQPTDCSCHHSTKHIHTSTGHRKAVASKVQDTRACRVALLLVKRAHRLISSCTRAAASGGVHVFHKMSTLFSREATMSCMSTWGSPIMVRMASGCVHSQACFRPCHAHGHMDTWF